jgi:curved DNA-binding protein
VQGGTLDLSIAGQAVSVKIPAGMEDGKALRLAGQAPGGGDLLLRIKIAKHEHYLIEDGQLVINVPISVSEAILGGAVDVPLPDGSKIAVKVPPGTSSGRKLRLRGKGIKGGDAYVRLQVMVPAETSDKAKDLIREFAQQQPEEPRSGPFWR